MDDRDYVAALAQQLLERPDVDVMAPAEVRIRIKPGPLHVLDADHMRSNGVHRAERYYCPRCGQVAWRRGRIQGIAGDVFLPHVRWISGEPEVCRGARIKEGNEAP